MSMQVVFTLFGCFAISFLFVLLLTPPFRRLLIRVGMVGQPSARRINKKPIPRGGGVVVFLGFILSYFAWIFLMGGRGILGDAYEQRLLFSLAGLLLLLVGLLDDAFDLKPLMKLAGQVIVATLLFLSGVKLGDVLPFDIPEALNYVLTLVWYIIIINAFNLIDGLDGLAVGLALIGSIGLGACLIGRGKALAAVPLTALAGACLGFLRYNFNPASIFLGDCGSMFIGLILATVPLVSGGKSAFVASIGVPLLVMGVPLFDTTLAIWRRSIRAAIPSADPSEHGLGRIMKPDMEHLHHRFLAMGLSQRQVALTLYVVSTIMVVSAILITLFSDRTTGIILIGAVLVFAIMVRHLSLVEFWDTGRAFLYASHTSLFERIIQPLYLVGDIAALALSWVASRKLAFVYAEGLDLISVFPIFFAGIILAMFIAGNYRRIWRVGNPSDYGALVLSITIGWGIGFAFCVLLERRFFGFNRQSFIFLLLSLVLMLLARMVRILVSTGMAATESARLRTDPLAFHTIAYGAGEHYQILALISRGSDLGHRRRHIVAVIDDDPLLRGRILNGAPIVGGVETLEDTILRVGANELFITADLLPEHLEQAMEVAAKHNLTVTTWECAVRELRAGKAPADPASRGDAPTIPKGS